MSRYAINRSTVPVSEAVEVLSSIGWAESGSSAPWSWDSEACQEPRLWAQALLLNLAGGDSHSSMSLARTGYYSGGRFTCREVERDRLRPEWHDNSQAPLSLEGSIAGPKSAVLCHIKQICKNLPFLNKVTLTKTVHTSNAHLSTSRTKLQERTCLWCISCTWGLRVLTENTVCNRQTNVTALSPIALILKIKTQKMTLNRQCSIRNVQSIQYIASIQNRPWKYICTVLA